MNNKEREIRQESDLSIKYEKAQQDVGLFYFYDFYYVHFPCKKDEISKKLILKFSYNNNT